MTGSTSSRTCLATPQKRMRYYRLLGFLYLACLRPWEINYRAYSDVRSVKPFKYMNSWIWFNSSSLEDGLDEWTKQIVLTNQINHLNSFIQSTKHGDNKKRIKQYGGRGTNIINYFKKHTLPQYTRSKFTSHQYS